MFRITKLIFIALLIEFFLASCQNSENQKVASPDSVGISSKKPILENLQQNGKEITNEEKLQIVNDFFKSQTEGNLKKALSYLTRKIRWKVWAPLELPIGRLFYGHNEVLHFFQIKKLLMDVEQDKRKSVLYSKNQIAILGYMIAKVKPKNVKYESDYVWIFTFKKGKIDVCEYFFDSGKFLNAYYGKIPEIPPTRQGN